MMCRKEILQTKRALGTVLLSALLAAVLLCACGKDSAGTAHDPSGTAAQSDGPALHLLTEPGRIISACAQTENGYYETVSNHQFGSNIVYTPIMRPSLVYFCAMILAVSTTVKVVPAISHYSGSTHCLQMEHTCTQA